MSRVHSREGGENGGSCLEGVPANQSPSERKGCVCRWHSSWLKPRGRAQERGSHRALGEGPGWRCGAEKAQTQREQVQLSWREGSREKQSVGPNSGFPKRKDSSLCQVKLEREEREP